MVISASNLSGIDDDWQEFADYIVMLKDMKAKNEQRKDFEEAREN